MWSTGTPDASNAVWGQPSLLSASPLGGAETGLVGGPKGALLTRQKPLLGVGDADHGDRGQLAGGPPTSPLGSHPG